MSKYVTEHIWQPYLTFFIMYFMMSNTLSLILARLKPQPPFTMFKVVGFRRVVHTSQYRNPCRMLLPHCFDHVLTQSVHCLHHCHSGTYWEQWLNKLGLVENLHVNTNLLMSAPKSVPGIFVYSTTAIAEKISSRQLINPLYGANYIHTIA